MTAKTRCKAIRFGTFSALPFTSSRLRLLPFPALTVDIFVGVRVCVCVWVSVQHNVAAWQATMEAMCRIVLYGKCVYCKE